MLSGHPEDVYKRQLFTQKQAEVFESIRQELTAAAPEAYKDLPKEMQEYQSYIVNDFLMNKKGILSLDAIDASDPTYIAWTKDSSKMCIRDRN